MDGVDEFLNILGEDFVVSKELAGRKGVKVSGEHLHSKEEALDHCQELVNKGGRFVIEESLLEKNSPS